MSIFGSNAAGLLSKQESLLHIVENLKPAVIMIQETKMKRKNKVKIDNYITFEHVRSDRNGGGLLTAIHSNLNPVGMGSEDENEVLVVEADTGGLRTRFINAYGPQESEDEEKKLFFFSKLDTEVKSAKTAGKLICLELDANSKLGKALNPNDPHDQSKNGELLAEVIEENDLIVVNSSNLCEGVITRKRVTINSVEESVIDYFIVCRLFYKLIVKMKIDEDGIFTLSKFSTQKGKKSIKKSDHNPLILDINLAWNSRNMKKTPRLEIFNFKKPKDFAEFQKNTENNDDLTDCFKDESIDVNVSSKRWLKIFNNILQRSFKKVRVKKNKNSKEVDKLITKREELKKKKSFDNIENSDVSELDEKIAEIDDMIAEKCAAKNKKIVEDTLKHIDNEIEGFNQPKIWKMKKLLAPKNTFDPPIAKLNEKGVLVNDVKNLEQLYIDTYVKRLTPNKMEDGLKDLESLKEFLFKLRYDIAKERKTPEWTLTHLDAALKTFKNNKARDNHGHVYELFKFGGRSLKVSILKLFNIIKKQQVFPDILQISNISSFYKNKGPKNDLDNDRGVFNVIKLRSILDKLIYNDIYETVDGNMSLSNIGGRRGRNIRDHLFVINGILNDALNDKNSNIDIHIYDVKKCFDKMWYSETANDFFDVGLQNDKFVTVANSNKNVQVAVKTPWGSLTERKSLNKIEMQGSVLTSLKCAVQIDSLGTECLTTGEGLYLYKNCLPIPPLSLVDDILAIAKCGVDSIKLNSIIQSKMATKKLELGKNKCSQMHVGQDLSNLCPTLYVHDDRMKTSSAETYLGDVLTNTNKIDLNIQQRYKKGVAAVNNIFSLLQEVSFGQFYFEVALLFRSSILINSMLCSSEVLYGITQKHIQTLEKCDRFFFSRLFSVPTERRS